MSRRTSQLQIRITEAEKAALRRLAEAAGTTVSAYVLAQALPAAGSELTHLLEELPRAGSAQRLHLKAIANLIADLSADEVGRALPPGALDGLSPVLANHVAALLEEAAHLRGGGAPAWVRAVPPLARPHFAWTLPSLRVHQLRVTPVAFKRRHLFLDPAQDRGGAAHDEATASWPARLQKESEHARRLQSLNQVLSTLELVVEFYILGDAVLSQLFRTRPGTARAGAQLAPSAALLHAVERLGQQEAWPGDWLAPAVRGSVAEDGAYVDLPFVRVFSPRPEHVLALLVLGLSSDATSRRLEDLAYVLRLLNVETPSAALEITSRYASDLQIPKEASATLQALAIWDRPGVS
ncbi:MAG: DUF1778 domain-containing protein [Gemmatimonadota bacterium]